MIVLQKLIPRCRYYCYTELKDNLRLKKYFKEINYITCIYQAESSEG